MKKIQRTFGVAQSLSCLLLSSGLLFAARPAEAITSYWVLQDANGNWTNAANWSSGIPMNPGDIAIITNTVAPTLARTITIDTAVSLKSIKFAIPNNALVPAITIQSLAGGALTMNSGDGSHSVIQQLRGSARCKISANTILSNDLDIINTVGAANYYDVSNPMSGTNDIHFNAGMGAAAGTPYMGVANTSFFGNMSIDYGTLMLSGSDTVFGSLTNGTRVITFYNNASLKNNGSLSVLGTNRQFVAGSGGGNLNLHGRSLNLPSPNQLTGSEVFTLSTDSGDNAGNVFSLSAANSGLTGALLVTANSTLKLGVSGSVSNCPLVNLSTATALFDATAKTAGYVLPASQMLAGIGTVSGKVSVASSSAKIHPGAYSLTGPTSTPGVLSIVTGGLTITNGGTYAWDLAQLKDNAYSPGTTTYSQLNVAAGAVNLAGGKLAINFNGVAAPDTTNAFWKTGHAWTILTASAPPSGTLSVTNGPYTNWAFTTRVTSNTLELVYGPYTSPPVGTMISVQ